MKVSTVIDEDFSNYRKPAMVVGAASCGGKCCLEAGIPLSVCQNDGWRSGAPIKMTTQELCERYMKNPITQAIVFGGLEPFERFHEILWFIRIFRTVYKCDDDIVLYTGYYPPEIKNELQKLKAYKNIIVKFGRYVPDRPHRYDDVLGVELVSDNQFAERIS